MVTIPKLKKGNLLNLKGCVRNNHRQIIDLAIRLNKIKTKSTIWLYACRKFYTFVPIDKHRRSLRTMDLTSIMDKKKKFRLARTRKLKKRNAYYLSYARSINSLNNIYVTTKLSRQGLITLREKLKMNEPFKLEIEIPTVNGLEVTKETDKSKIVEILKRSIKFELFVNSLISAISITENFLEDVIRKVLQNHPWKLSVDIDSKTKKETQEDRKITIKDVLKVTSLEELYEDIINQKLHKLFYASPTDYFKYLKNNIQIDLEQNLIDNYIEIKATRDLLVHNRGKVNNIYIAKVGNKARVTDTKQNIPITEDYFLESIGILKKVIRDTYASLSKEYLEITEKKDLYPPMI